MSDLFYVRPTWSLPEPAPWDKFSDIAAGLSNLPEWRDWADRYDVATVEATLVVEDRADPQTRLRRDRSGIQIDHHVSAAVFDRDDMAPYDVFRHLIREVWSASAAELGWDPPPELPPRATRGLGAPPSTDPAGTRSEAQPPHEFWDHVSVLDGVVTEQSAERLVHRLAATSRETIRAFADHLALALHALDTRTHAGQPVRDASDPPDAAPIPLTADAFLHVRCAVVAAGQATYDRVRTDSAELAGTWAADEAEDLLFVAADAWERLTGTEWGYDVRRRL